MTRPSRSAMFAIWYADGRVVRGYTRSGWQRAPRSGVQVVTLDAPYPDREGVPFRPWAGVDDRQIWTGQDEYDPFGWGVKEGTLIADDDYRRIYREAAHGDRNA